jgi:hypothetical protein
MSPWNRQVQRGGPDPRGGVFGTGPPSAFRPLRRAKLGAYAAMQRWTAQASEVIWPLSGQNEFLWMIVTLVFASSGTDFGAPAKAPAVRNSAAKAADSVRVFSGFVILLSRLGIMR